MNTQLIRLLLSLIWFSDFQTANIRKIEESEGVVFGQYGLLRTDHDL